MVMDIWGWICSLSSSEEWQGSMELGSMKDEHSDNTNTRTLLIKSERTAGSDTETLLTFSLCLQGFWPSPNPPSKTLWISDPVPMPVPTMKEKTILPLLHQLIQEIINRAAPLTSTTHKLRAAIKLKPSFLVVDNIEESLLSHFFNLVFLCRLFWLCVCDAPTQVGSLYFQTMASQLDLIFLSCKPLLGFFLKSIGADLELHFMRSMGYILTKLLILRELDSNHGHHHHREQQQQQQTWWCAHSHATDTKGGFWLLKGYSPLLAMHREANSSHQNQYPSSNLPEDTKKAVLRYALAHQQLEAVAQLEFKVYVLEDHVRVDVRIDNLRLNVAKLAFSSTRSCGGEEDDDDGGGVGLEMVGEKHFPSRVCVWVGPGDEVDADVEGLSLERSSGNPEREVESQRIVKGSVGSTKFPKVKATWTSATRTRLRNWNVEQSAEGNTALFQMDLCDNASGIEVCSWRPTTRPGGGGVGDPRIGFRNRYSGGCRSFNKMGGVVFARDEYGQGVSWRLSKETLEEGSVLKWRLGTKVWLTYWPNQCTTSYFETRSVEWCEEVDLHVTKRT